MTPDLEGLRIGYAPYSPGLEPPGDRRRFGFYARERGVAFEVADPAREYDIVVLSGRADLSVWRRYRGRAKLVFDLVNAYLSVPRGGRDRLRGMAKFATREFRRPVPGYRDAVEAMCRRADAVVCATEETRDTVRPLCANVHVIVDSFHDVVGPRKDDYRAGEPFNLVWEGLPENLVGFAGIRTVLEDFAREHPFTLHVVTGLVHFRHMGRFRGRPTARTVREVLGERLAESTFLYEWNRHTLGPIATAGDLGVIPLPLDDPFARGKPANKLIGMWWMGLPTLASATPAYRKAASAAGTPEVTCASEDEWAAALRRYATSEDARREAGTRGLDYVSAEHSDEQLLDRWDAVFASVLGSDARTGDR